jgi:hypothetical protein
VRPLSSPPQQIVQPRWPERRRPRWICAEALPQFPSSVSSTSARFLFDWPTPHHPSLHPWAARLADVRHQPPKATITVGTLRRCPPSTTSSPPCYYGETLTLYPCPVSSPSFPHARAACPAVPCPPTIHYRPRWRARGDRARRTVCAPLAGLA